jgi:hypothetical protein
LSLPPSMPNELARRCGHLRKTSECRSPLTRQCQTRSLTSVAKDFLITRFGLQAKHHFEGSAMKIHPGFFAALCAISATCAQAQSASNATLDLTVQASTGFSWVTNPDSDTTTNASAATLTGWSPSAGVFSPVFGPTVQSSQSELGPAIQNTSVVAGTSPVVGSGSSTSNPSGSVSQFLASAEVNAPGKAEATSFARSWFSLDAGATVTFTGSLSLSTVGSNPAQPVGYQTGDFYSFASGLLAVDAQLFSLELGGPVTTGAVGGYNLSDSANWNLTVTNTNSTPLLTYLDSGVTVYTVSAVPEPGAYLLSLAGLLILGLKARSKAKAR